MKIKYNNRALLHAYQKHGVTKDQIENSLASGIEKRIRDKVNDSIIIFTKNLCIVVDYSLNLRTAFIPNKRYYKSKINRELLFMKMNKIYAKDINQNKPLAIISEGYLSIKIYDVRREYFDEYVVWNWSDETDIRISKLRGNKFRVGHQWYTLNDALKYNFF